MKTDGLTKTQRYRLKDVEEYKKRKRDYMRKRREDPAYRAKHNATVIASYHRNKHKPENQEARLNYHLWRNYRIRKADYDSMLETQNGLCAICGNPPTEKGKKLAVDHDHVTGVVRGLLCTKCNPALGWFEKYAESAREYLEGK